MVSFKNIFIRENKPIVFSSNYKKSIITELNKSKVNDIQLTTFVSNGNEIGVQHPFDWELLESAYLSIPVIQGAIDKHVDFVLGSDYKVESDSDRVVKKYNEFVRDTDFSTILRPIVRDTLIFGNAFAEIVYNGTKIEQFKQLDSKTMFVRRDPKGKILGYTQFFKNKTGVDPVFFKPNEIAHFSFNNMGSCPYGTSVIRSLFGDGASHSAIKQYMDTSDAMSRLLLKQVDAKIHVKMGDKENHPTQPDIDEMTKLIEESKNDTHLVTSYLVDMKILGYEGKTLDLAPFINFYEDQMVGGLQTPYVLLGKANVPEGLANVQMEAFENRVKSVQSFIARELENKVFNLMFGNNDYRFVWGRRVKKELDELNSLIRYMSEKVVLSPDTRFIIENRVRNILGTPSLSMDDYTKSLDADAERVAKMAPAKIAKKDSFDNEEI